MTYYGSVNKNITDLNLIYTFLQKALSLIPKDKPFRGPKKYQQNDLEYINTFSGNLENFSGEEIIKFKGKEIYQAKYAGGLVDQKR